MGGIHRTHGEIRNAYKLLDGKSEGKKPLGHSHIILKFI
jgi:hypothetical protein